MTKTIPHAQLMEELMTSPAFQRVYEAKERLHGIAQTLRTIREEQLGLTQSEAAKLLGMTQPELSRFERGIGAMGATLATVDKIVDGYDAALQERGVGLKLSVEMVAVADHISGVHRGLTVREKRHQTLLKRYAEEQEASRAAQQALVAKILKSASPTKPHDRVAGKVTIKRRDAKAVAKNPRLQTKKGRQERSSKPASGKGTVRRRDNGYLAND